MDQNLYNIAIAATGAAIGWVVKVIWDAVRALEQVCRRALQPRKETTGQYGKT